MTDETYTFIERQRELKSAAHGAYHKVSGAKSKKCTMPSDYLTAAQKRRMNGTMKSYTLNTPHYIEEIKLWPEDLQREYLSRIEEKYNTPGTLMAQMLGISQATYSRLRATLGMPDHTKWSRSRTPEQVAGFARFLGGETTPEPEAQEPEAQEPEAPVMLPTQRLDEITFAAISDVDGLVDLIRQLIPATGEYRFRVTAERRQEA